MDSIAPLLKDVGDSRKFGDAKIAMTRILQLTYALEREADNGRIPLGPINLTMLSEGASAEEYRAGLEQAVGEAYLKIHASGAYVMLTGKRQDQLV